MNSFYPSMIKKNSMDTSEHAHLFPFSAIMNSEVTQLLPPMFLIPSVSPTGFSLLVRIQSMFYSFCPLISCSSFSNRSLPADVWGVKVMTSPHDYYRAKQSLPPHHFSASFLLCPQTSAHNSGIFHMVFC